MLQVWMYKTLVTGNGLPLEDSTNEMFSSLYTVRDRRQRIHSCNPVIGIQIYVFIFFIFNFFELHMEKGPLVICRVVSVK